MGWVGKAMREDEVAARIQQLREMVPPERREFVDEMHRELNPGWEPEPCS